MIDHSRDEISSHLVVKITFRDSSIMHSRTQCIWHIFHGGQQQWRIHREGDGGDRPPPLKTKKISQYLYCSFLKKIVFCRHSKRAIVTATHRKIASRFIICGGRSTCMLTLLKNDEKRVGSPQTSAKGALCVKHLHLHNIVNTKTSIKIC